MNLLPLSISQFLETITRQSNLPAELSNITDLSYNPSTIIVCPTNNYGSIPVEIELDKNLNINSQLSLEQKEQLLNLLREHKDEFSWEYIDMNDTNLDISTHHVYIQHDVYPFRKPQHKMNHMLREIVKQ